jgi:hypothetical protein
VAHSGQNRGLYTRGGKEKSQTVCKPGSVPACAGNDHSSGTPVTGRLTQPTRTAAWKYAWLPRKPAVPIRFCSRWGLPCHVCYQTCGALLPHPFTLTSRTRSKPAGEAVYSLWHFPWGRPRRVLPGTVSPWSPDFPPSAISISFTNSGHPTVWRVIHITDALTCKFYG